MQENIEPSDFYIEVVRDLLSSGVVSVNSSILAVCGGEQDYATFLSLGFQNVTISNLDVRMEESGSQEFAPFHWSYQDAEALTYKDNSFELVVVHSGLHHLRCPQKGIAEMYRVASNGILAFEPNRNLFTKLGVLLGFGQEYETAAVFYNDCKFGGVANTAVPNYVYRFSADDVRRAVQAYAPVAKHECRFWYATRLPDRLFKMKNRYFGKVAQAARPLLLFFGKFGLLANNIAFFVRKPSIPDDLFPWLTSQDEEIAPDESYLTDVYTRPRPGV